MKRAFVRTSNVKLFTAAVERLQNREEDVPGMALLYSDPGLGKTKACIWWCNKKDGVFLRTKKLMTGRWLLEELVSELGEQADRRISDLYRQARTILLERPRIVFVDEIDYLTHDARIIETLRDLHDDTGNPFVFIGMGQADKKLSRYKHLYDRFSEIIKFNDLTEADVKTIADEMCDVKLKDDAVKYIHSQANKFRKIVVWMYRIERIARTRGLKEMSAEDISGRDK